MKFIKKHSDLIINDILPIIFAVLFILLPMMVSANQLSAPHTLSFGVSIRASTTTSEVKIPIYFSNDGTLVNAAQIELLFDPTKLHIQNIVIEEALCEERFIISKEIDNVDGRIYYACGTVTPYSGMDVILAYIVALPLGNATTTVSFGTETSVHAHDGYGTQVLEEANNSTFIFSE